jgi:prepilin-type N-terminal cleavage/methylation domain-containing protein
MNIKTLKQKKGFTLNELVVAISILGILASTAIPRLSNVQSQTQKDINVTNINVIRETFFHYYYRQHMAGKIPRSQAWHQKIYLARTRSLSIHKICLSIMKHCMS